MNNENKNTGALAIALVLCLIVLVILAICVYEKFTSSTPYGILLSNPPYGERLSDEKEVQILMRELGKAFKALPNWSGYFLTSLEQFERYFGKSADRKKKLFNANLPCGFYSYLGKKP